jgi:hypothetical protein
VSPYEKPQPKNLQHSTGKYLSIHNQTFYEQPDKIGRLISSQALLPEAKFPV